MGARSVPIEPSHKQLGHHGSLKGLLGKSPDLRKAVAQVEFDRLDTPTKPCGNDWDWHFGIIHGHGHHNLVGVTVNQMNVQAHVVLGIGVGINAGLPHDVRDMVRFKNIHLVPDLACERRRQENLQLYPACQHDSES